MSEPPKVFYGFQSGTYCPEFACWVDYHLVKVKKPKCIEKNKGCGNCPKVCYAIEEELCGKKTITIKKIVNR